MRNDVFPILYSLMQNDTDIVVLTGDLGYLGFDKIRDDFPDRFYNVGAAEQTMLDMAVGLALSGKKPVCYSITPFLLYRGFETIRTYIDHENIPVTLLGSGRDKDYIHDGFSHYAGDDVIFLGGFKNLKSYWPKDTQEMKDILAQTLQQNEYCAPTYINLKK